MVRFY